MGLEDWDTRLAGHDGGKDCVSFDSGWFYAMEVTCEMDICIVIHNKKLPVEGPSSEQKESGKAN